MGPGTRKLLGWVVLGACWQGAGQAADPVYPDPLTRPVAAPQKEGGDRPGAPSKEGDTPSKEGDSRTAPMPPSLLVGPAAPIDLPAAIQLATGKNPEIFLAREGVSLVVAERQLAAVQFLPDINLGGNYDQHTGTLQQSSGNILKINRQTLYLGGGANAIAAGTVSIPGLWFHGNLAEGYYGYLVARQRVVRRRFEAQAVENDVLLRVGLAYLDLLRDLGRVATLRENRAEAAEVARLTANYARRGQGRQADADRAASELARRDIELMQTEGEALTRSARLAQLLDLDPAVRLHPADSVIVPIPLVPEKCTLSELIAMALLQRPELAERRAAIAEALMVLQGAKALPFSPTVLIGESVGTFGGGSNYTPFGVGLPTGGTRQSSSFGSFGERSDFDAIVYWTARNLGVGNVALIRIAASGARASEYRFIIELDRVRAEVATAFARSQARFAQLTSAEQAVRSAKSGYEEDLRRIRAAEGLPIEVTNSLNLLDRARLEYLDAIIGFNEAQLALYTAIGQPPASLMAKAAGQKLAPPATPEDKSKEKGDERDKPQELPPPRKAGEVLEAPRKVAEGPAQP